MIRVSVLATAVWIAGAGGLHAQPFGAPYVYSGPTLPTPARPTVSPDRLLEQGLERMRGFLAQGGARGPDRVEAFLEEQIAPYFDFDRMAAWVARPYYRRMAPVQQAKLREDLKERFLAILARELGSFTRPQPRVDYYRPVPIGPDEMEVGARVLPAAGYPIRLGFRFHLGDDGWKVVDVSSNGHSAVQYFRQRFLSTLERYGLKARRAR
jgi:phospholipid transport system substrate-binding protein